MSKEAQDDRPKGSNAFIFFLLVVLFVFVFTVGQGPADPTTAAGGQGGDPDQTAEPMSEEDFWKHIEKSQPVFNVAETQCLVDGTKFDMPFNPRGSDNRAGGVATDLMKIAIRPAEDSEIKPNFDLQEFEQKMGTCPTCGATYMDIDLFNIRSTRIENGVDNLQAWDLSERIPGLVVEENESWTTDVRGFVRYNVQQQAGFPPNELGFTALAAAYCTNFSVWYGKEYTVPSPAYYALAAAQIRVDLEQDLPQEPSERSISAMVLGELYRLLGRSADSAHWYSYARGQGSLAPGFLVVLEFSENNLANGDFSLKRIPDMEEGKVPPIGWQIDNMLPNINGHITQHRNDWAGLDDPVEIEAKIISVIAAGAGY